jgi:23S rRNA pseudouridine1911/1915/1917 synthase
VSGAPRLALHAVELGFQHPVSSEVLHWTMEMPPDLEAFISKLRRLGKATPKEQLPK